MKNLFNKDRYFSEISLLGFILLTLMLGQISCKKEPEYKEGTLHGRVIDHVTKEPVEGARILFRYRDQCQWSDSDFCWTMLDSTSYVSDNEGEFVINFKVEARKVANADASLGAKPMKEGYFFSPGLSNGVFASNRDTLTVAIWPKTYLRVHIIDETRDPHMKYDGIRLWHTTFVPIDTVLQHPLDTIIIVDGNPAPLSPSIGGYRSLTWNLIYLDNPGILGPRYSISNVQCPPHDTCDIEIRF